MQHISKNIYLYQCKITSLFVKNEIQLCNRANKKISYYFNLY